MNLVIHIWGIVRMTDMLYVMGDAGTKIGSLPCGSKESTKIKALSQFWTGLQINLIEHLG